MRKHTLLKALTVVACLLMLSVPNSWALDCLCNGDFDYDGDIDGRDVGWFKTDAGRENCTCYRAPVEKTGQTTSYQSYDDGDLEKGVAWPYPYRFTDNGDGTATDELTGLIWLQDANCPTLGQRSWSEAFMACALLCEGSCNLTDGSTWFDWRLPNIKELQSLIDFSKYGPALPTGHPFTNAQSLTYCSSITYAFSTDVAWVVIFGNGDVDSGVKSDYYHVWPVRGGY